MSDEGERRPAQTLVDDGEFIREVLDTAPCLVYAHELESARRRYLNAGLERVLGHDIDDGEMGGSRPLAELIHPDDWGALLQHLQAMRRAADGQVLDARYRMRHADGSWRTMHGFDRVRARDANGAVTELAGMALDVTALERATRESRRLQAQLQQAHKLEALGNLATGVAHDFNNLLTVILGQGDLVLSQLDTLDPAREEMDSLIGAAERAAWLTRQLLLFSRNKPTRRVALDLNRVVIRLERMLRRVLGEDIDIERRLQRGVWPVVGDPGSIEQVVINLAVNAADAMPRGGLLTLRTVNRHLTEEETGAVGRVEPGRYVCLVVEDEGGGMIDDVIDRAFEPFFTTRPGGRHSGLGLSVVYGAVQQSGGAVLIDSEPGVGTIVRVFMPVASDEPREEERHAVELADLAGRGERILVVEDDETVLGFVLNALQRYGYDVIVAQDKRTALELFEDQRDSIQIVLSDVVLPDGDGLELALLMRQRVPGLPIVLSSGYADERSQWPRIQQSGMPFLQKPYNIAHLLQTLADALGRDPGAG